MVRMAPEDTRRAAWERAQGFADSLEEQIFLLVKATDGGLTADEVQQVTEIYPSTVAARVATLKKNGKLFDSGIRRKTRRGSPAAVMTADQPDDGQMDLPGFPGDRR